MHYKTTLKKFTGIVSKCLMMVGMLCFLAGASQAQPYINGPLSTGATTSNGTAAPTGFTWSELQVGNTSLGAGANISAGLTVADNFTVPAGVTWNITKITFYGYSTGYTGATSPFNDTRLQIFNTDPQVGTPTPVFGNLTTNRFLASSSADMYRIGNAAAGTTRKIWKIEVTVNTSLTAGTYWLEWQHGTVTGVTSNFSPTKTVVGQATQAGNDAKQHDLTAGTWTGLVDGTSPAPQDMPFQIDYTATGSPCAAVSPGATTASVSPVCAGSAFTLSVATPGSGLGLSYQWQRSTDNVTYTDIAGATNPTLSTNITASTWYRLRVTCGANAALFSTPTQVVLQTTGCYCAAAAGNVSPAFEKISNVTFGTINNSSTSPAGYEDFTALTPVPGFTIGEANTITVTASNGYDFDAVNVWIDLNQDGDFTDAGEFVYESDLGAGPFTGTITIPGSATLGNTRMRIRLMDYFEVVFSGAPEGPCGVGGYGQVEDYTIKINPCVPVTLVAPLPASTSIACGGTATFTATTEGTGPVYSWEYRTSATGTWLPLADGGIFTGAATNKLVLTNVPQTYNGYQFRPLFSGFCSGLDFGPAVTLTVTAIVPVISPATSTLCVGSIQALTLTNTLGDVNVINEGFNAVGMPAGWAQKNNSTPVGTNPDWAQGSTTVFTSQNGAPESFFASNFNSVAGDNTISNWLFTPVVTLKNGDVFSFYTRTVDEVLYADRMQVRMSTAGASTNVGATNTSVGDFTTLLTDINSGLTLTGYPNTWTKYTFTISGMSAGTTGRFAFRYYVPSGGPAGDNSSYVGIDNVVYTTPGGPAQGIWTSTPGTAQGTIYSNSTATTVYVPGTPATTVYVKPDSTRTYNVTFTTPTPCTSGVTSITVNVSHPVTGTYTVANKAVCLGGNTSFTSTASAGATGLPILHQWKVSTNGGATYTNVANSGVYTGATTSTLTITGATTAMNGYSYKDSVYVTACASFVISNAATLTVNQPPVLNLAAAPTLAVYPGITTSVVVAVNPAPGAGTTYEWTYNGAPLTSATTNTISGIGVDALGTYSVKVTDANGCSTTSANITISDSATTTLFVYPNPSNGQFHVRYHDLVNTPTFRGPRTLTVYDSKGSRVFAKTYSAVAPYTDMFVDISNHGKGIYSVELTDFNGARIKTGRVLIQ